MTFPTLRHVLAHLRPLGFATLLVSAATVAGSAVWSPAIARAEPRQWDIGEYDICVGYFLAEYQKGTITFQQYNADVRQCCVNSGGNWSGGQCVAPPVESDDTQSGPSSPPRSTPTVTFTPAPGNPSGLPRPGGAVG
jgi:hypothetical protein